MSNKNTLAQRAESNSFSSFMNLPAVRQKVYDIVAGKDGDRFITSIVTAVGTNKDLAQCDYSSILSAALLGESLKLSPSPQLGHFYMVPYNVRDIGKAAQFQLGYKGYIQLAIRSGQYRDLDVISVKEGELISYDPFNRKTEFNPITDPIERENAKTIGYFAYFELLNGFRKELYWSRDQMKAHAEHYSPGYRNDIRKNTSYTFWSKDFDGMAQKTMLRQLISKWGIMSIDMQQGLSGDMAVIDDEGKYTYVEEIDFKDVTPAEEDKEHPEPTKIEEELPEDHSTNEITQQADDQSLPFDIGNSVDPDQQSLEEAFFS